MALEIERKFLLRDPSVLSGAEGHRMLQAYVATGAAAVRVRVTDDAAVLTLKGSTALDAQGRVRHEWEFALERSDAIAMANLPGTFRLEKTRYRVPVGELTYEIDRYHGSLEGYFTVEVETPQEKVDLVLPPWVGAEITGVLGYSNERLARDGWPH